MTNKELHIAIDQEALNTGLTFDPDYQREEVDLMINESIYLFIKEALPRRVQSGELLDSFTENSQRIQKLIKPNITLAVSNQNEVLLPNGSTVKLYGSTVIPEKYLFLLSAKCEGVWCGQTHQAPLRINSNVMYQNNANPFLKSKTYSIRGRHNNDKIILEPVNGFTISKVTLDYIRVPKVVKYSETEYEYTDIPQVFHGEIVEAVVRKLRKRQQPDYQVSVAEEMKVKTN